jgi:hypothetical protein
MDYHQEENDTLKRLLTPGKIDEILQFQLQHKLQVYRLPDFMFACDIDGEIYGAELTFMGALVFGIREYKKHKEQRTDG